MTNRDENSIDFNIPMGRAVVEAIKSLQKKPILLGISVGIAGGWTNYCSFVRWKNALAESIFTVALSKCAMLLNRKTSKETKGILKENGRETIAFGPNAVFMVTEHHNPRLHTKREEMFVLLNG
jgi:hypothetical protein